MFWKKNKLQKIIIPDDYENKSIAGMKFRVFKSPAKLPFYRAIRFLNLREQGMWRLTEESINFFFDKTEKLIKAGQNDEALKLISYVKELRGMTATIAEIIEYIDCFILLEGEPLDKVHPAFKQAKIQLAENSEIMDFFLTIAMPLFSNLKNSEINMLSYLREGERVLTERRLLRLIGKPLVLNFSKVPKS